MECPLVGRHLQHGCDGIACWCSTTSGEHDHLASGGHHRGDRCDVETGRVHHHGSLLGRPYRLWKHLTDGTRTAFPDTSETFLLKSGESAGLVAWRRLSGTAVLSRCGKMCLVFAAHLYDLVVNLGRGRALGQDVLTAYPFYRLAHHRRATHVYQDVAHLTHRGIAGDARRGIRTATFNADIELRSIKQFLLLHAGLLRHLAGGTGGLLYRLQCAAFLLDAEGNNGFLCQQTYFLLQLPVGHCLTSQSDDNYPVDVGMASKTSQDFLTHIGVGLHVGTSCVEDDVHGTAYLTGNNPATLAGTDACR